MSDASRSNDEIPKAASRAGAAGQREGGGTTAEAATRLPVLTREPLFGAAPDPAKRRRRQRGRAIGAIRAAASLAAVVVIGAAAAAAHVHALNLASAGQAQAQETTRRLDTMSSRLETLEANRSRDEVASLRKVLAEIKASAASTRDVGGAVGQLAARVDRMEKEQGARLDKLGERIDHDSAARLAEVTTQARQAGSEARRRRGRGRAAKPTPRRRRWSPRRSRASRSSRRALSRSRDPACVGFSLRGAQRLRDDRQPQRRIRRSARAISCPAAAGCCGSNAMGATGWW